MKRFRLFLALFVIAIPLSGIHADSMSQAHRLYFSGQMEQALLSYRTILNKQPSLEAAMNAAVVAQERGHHRQAIAIMESARQKGINDAPLLRHLAWAKLNEGHVESAQKLFEEAMSQDDSDPLATLGLSMAKLEQNDSDEAADLLSKLVRVHPKLAAAHFFLGKALEQKKKWTEAISSYEDAIRADSHFVEARLPLGYLFEKLKKPDDAWKQFTRLRYVFETYAVSNALERLSPRITKKPQEIMPPKQIEHHSSIPSVYRNGDLPQIRVGIGTSSSGRPTPKKTLSFRTSHPFTITELDSSKILVSGSAKEPWTIQLHSAGVASILDSSGQTIATFKGRARIQSKDRERGTIILNTLTFAPGSVWGGMSDREFRGDIEVIASLRYKRLIIINIVSVEEYLYGVLAAEMPVKWPLEALKAQAVMARNVGLLRSRSLHLHSRYAYDLCDEQHCQVYAGVGVESDKARRAVDETRGRSLTFNGKICHTVFSSNCGGMTQRGSQAGWGDMAYWSSVSDAPKSTDLPTSPWDWRQWVQQPKDVYCQASTHVNHAEYRWVRVVPASVLAEKMRRKRRLGRVRQIYILKRATSGRVQKVRIIGTKGEIILTKEHQIRKYLGLGSLRSTMFFVDTVVRDSKAKDFIFYGAGWGHGVGFCQSGAAGRAENGASYEDILSGYFPGTTLE